MMNRGSPTRLHLTCRLALATAAIGLFAIACSDGGSPATPPMTDSAKATASPTENTPGGGEPAAAAETAVAKNVEAPSPADLAKRGRSVYMANCIACHSQDPAQDGALGPAVAGSSRELLEARVMRAEYPPGYTPKRDSKVMIALPHLENELDALAAYLSNDS